MLRNGTEQKYDVNGLDRCLVSFVPASFIGSSGGGIAQVVHRSAVEQVVTLTAGVTVSICFFSHFAHAGVSTLLVLLYFYTSVDVSNGK